MADTNAKLIGNLHKVALERDEARQQRDRAFWELAKAKTNLTLAQADGPGVAPDVLGEWIERWAEATASAAGWEGYAHHLEGLVPKGAER